MARPAATTLALVAALACDSPTAVEPSGKTLLTPATASETIDLDTFEAPNDGFAGPYFGSMVLEAGRKYRVTVQGTRSAWPWWVWRVDCTGTWELQPMFPSPATFNGIVGLDPEYLFAWPALSPEECELSPPLPNPDGRPWQISLDGGVTWFHPAPEDPTYTATHAYRYIVTGEGRAAAVGLPDTPTTDNYGVFKVTIEPWIPTIDDIRRALELCGIANPGIRTSLERKLDVAQAALDAGDPGTAVEILGAFVHEVEAQAGNHIPTACAEELRAMAEALMASLR